jgi:hypothetical protein
MVTGNNAVKTVSITGADRGRSAKQLHPHPSHTALSLETFQ